MAVVWLHAPATGLTSPEEVKGSRSESWTQDEISADVDLKVLYSQVIPVLENILVNEVPWPYPNTQTALYAQSGGLKPFDGKAVLDAVGGHGLSYKYAILHVHFAPPVPFNWGISTDPGNASNTVYYTEAFEPNAEMLSMPGSAFKWMSDDEPLTDEEAGGRLVHSFDYNVNFTGIQPGTIPSGYFDYGSRTNSDVVSSARLGKSFAIGTLLYNSPKLTGKKSNRPTEDRLDMSCRWSYRKDGWNKLWRAKTKTFDTYYEVGGLPVAYDNYPPVAMAGMVP